MKYILLNPDHYADLNHAISEAFGFGEGKSTERYTTDEPEQIGEYSVMIITAEVQERFPELLEGLELIDTLPTQEYESDTTGQI